MSAYAIVEGIYAPTAEDATGPRTLVTFFGYIKHGNHDRKISVAVHAETITKLAEALKHTGGHAGHAVWHVQNNVAAPCPQCGRQGARGKS